MRIKKKKVSCTPEGLLPTRMHACSVRVLLRLVGSKPTRIKQGEVINVRVRDL